MRAGISKFVLLAAAWAGWCACAAHETLQPAGRIPTLAWHGPPESEATPARYAELAAAGFTRNFSHFSTNDAMERALETARGAGLKLMISTPELHSDPETTVRRFREHPAAAGYYLRDEPNAADFAGLAEWARRIQAVDTRLPCYINLFPTYANEKQLGTATYQEHVDRFAAEVPVPFISFDHYPVIGDRLRPDFYENLEIIAAKARETGKPFWAFAMSVALPPYPRARMEHMRFETYSALAYGAQCIQYFTYWTPQSGAEQFSQAPIERDGSRTVVYDRVRAMNAEMAAVSPVFKGARVVAVGHTGELPRGTKAFQPEAPILDLKTDGGALVSVLENKGRRFLVVVNRDIHRTMNFSLRWDATTRVLRVDRSGALRPAGRGQWASAVGPGDARIFTWTAAR